MNPVDLRQTGPDDRSAGLYVHIPFCRRKCRYCDFYSVPDTAKTEVFLDALHREADLIRPVGIPFDTVHLGGGTPSLLTPYQVTALLAHLSRSFTIFPGAEITLEANPGTLTAEKLAGFRRAGVNRLTIGIQSFDDEVLSFLGRIHTGDEAEQSIETAREAGFDNLGLDLIFGIPGVTDQDWRQDLARALRYRPEHLSCYLLTYEPGTPLARDLEKKRFLPPAEEEIRTLFLTTRSVLREAGYLPYEISNFARSPAFRSRHNLKYWTLAPYLGLGPSAHSFAGYRRHWNHPALEPYLSDLSAGRRPLAGSEDLTEVQRMMEWIYLGLRIAEGISIPGFEAEFGVNFDRMFGGVLEKLSAEGMTAVSAERCALTDLGALYLDSITSRLVSLLPGD